MGEQLSPPDNFLKCPVCTTLAPYTGFEKLLYPPLRIYRCACRHEFTVQAKILTKIENPLPSHDRLGGTC